MVHFDGSIRREIRFLLKKLIDGFKFY
jgi:hypothetical protein